MPHPPDPILNHPVILRDAMYRAALLVAVTSGLVTKKDAIQACGFLPGELEEEIREAAQAGEKLIQVYRQTQIPWRVVWQTNTRDALEEVARRVRDT